MIPREEVVAIIPARGGSKGVPGKNLKEIGGVPLVGRSVQAAMASTRIGSVYVSSDDHDILAAGKKYGAGAILRPAHISGDKASSEAALTHGIEEIRRSGKQPSVVVFIQCTSPFTGPDDLDRLVAALEDQTICASLTVSEDHGFLWRQGEDGRGHGINHDETKARQRRQDMQPQYRENGAAYAMKIDPYLALGRRFCGPVAIVETHMPSLEIDEPADLILAQAWWELSRRKSRASHLETLKTIRALVTDFDGVHTDDTVLVDQDGKESVICSRSDGMGIAKLASAGYKVLILSKEQNPVVTARAKKLRVECRQGIDEKKGELERWAAEQGLSLNEIAYVGNDVNDLECLRAVGLSIAPCDAHPDVLAEVRWTLSAPGGRGALREICDTALKAPLSN